ncbi:MAG: hypothetical protein OES13_12220, partial [Acidimicrobiia bacterium]|nr:hypothetical protein [Acidimicrobiia bacterium]
MITFLRLRPADDLKELWAATRRREGTTAVESPNEDDRSPALAGGLLAVATSPTPGAVAWVVPPADAIALGESGARGWQLTVEHTEDRAAVVDALARTEAAYLRTRRSTVAAAAEIARIPGLNTTVSVFVDSVEEAVAAIGSGAGDLLLRDWDTERIGSLRDALSGALVERTAIPLGIDIDSVRETLDAESFTVYLGQVDGSGAARPRYEWAPGMDMAPPVPEMRISGEWPDRAWLNGTAPAGLDSVSAARRRVLQRSLDGSPPSRDEIELLFTARGDDVDAIAAVADELRRRANGDTVTYVVNRNINYTNQCYFRCGFCAFSKGPRSLNLRGDPYLLEVHEVAFRTKEAWDAGATEVCLQGG